MKAFFLGTSINLLRAPIAALGGARTLAYHHDMSRVLRSVRLALGPLATVLRGALLSLVKWSLRLFGLVVLAFLVYIWAPAFHRYHYISLEGAEGMVVLERGPATPPMVAFLIGTIPTRYRAERPGYTVRFNVPEYTQGSDLEITVTPPAAALRFEREDGSSHDWCGGGEPWNTFTSPPTWIFSAWQCTPERERTRRVMRFDVLDADGTVLGHEEIPYRRVTRGFYFYLDLL